MPPGARVHGAVRVLRVPGGGGGGGGTVHDCLPGDQWSGRAPMALGFIEG